jgi:hypothetical protein
VFVSVWHGRLSCSGLNCTALAPGKAAQLYVCALHVNGDASSHIGRKGGLIFDYSVSKDGTADISEMQSKLAPPPVEPAVEKGGDGG